MLNLNNFKALSLSLSAESEGLNSSKLNTCSNESGRSMIEMLGVLAIIGVLSVGGIAGYSKAMMKFKTNKTIDQIAMTVTNIRTLYAQQRNYKGLVTTNAYAMGVTDDAMGKSGSLKNAFGGPVYISSAKSGAVGEVADSGAFVVTFGGLPREACVAIATNDWGSGYSSGLLGIGTGVTGSGNTSGGTTTEPEPEPEPTQSGWNMNLLISEAFADTTDTDDNAQNVPCDIKGGTTNAGAAGGDIKEYACAVGVTSAAMTVAKAASGCDCENANTCFVSLKYY